MPAGAFTHVALNLDAFDSSSGCCAGGEDCCRLLCSIITAVASFTANGARDLVTTAVFIASLSACNVLSWLSRLMTIFVWKLDPEFVRSHATHAYGQREVTCLSDGVSAGLRVFRICASSAISDLVAQPLALQAYGWDEWGGWTGAGAGLRLRNVALPSC